MSTERRTPILHSRLVNGLEVFLREDHAAPLASFWVFYRVGSRNESPGQTGISHWVEHMQFKGTPSVAKGQIFRDVSRHGGTLNALTSHDWTAYFETLPADRIDLSLAIESDRMGNSLFDPTETESERTVILSERQGAENQPVYLLAEEVVGAAFRAHPYRHMVIGHEADLRSLTRDDLYAHYRRFYSPSNAFIVAAGDFAAEALLERIETAFGPISAGTPATTTSPGEPLQLAERRVILRRPAPTAYLRMAYKVPEARHPDTAALLVADAILSGAKGMGLAGGGALGRSSRLYRRLVSGGIARSVGSDVGLHLDPYLFVFGASALPGIEPDRMEEAIESELVRLAEEAPAEGELARAIKQVRAQYVYSAEGVTNQAFWIGQMEIVDRFDRADGLVDELAAVTAEDVRRVAATYFRPDQRTVGWLVPTTTGGASGTDIGDAAPFRLWGVGGAVAERSSSRPFERRALSSGAVLLTQVRPGDPAVSVRLRLAAGALGDPEDKEGLAVLAARAMLRGTLDRSFEEINEFTDGRGASISVDAGRHATEVSIRCLREDLKPMLALAAEILRAPAFPEVEVEQVRRELLTAISEANQDTRATANRVMRRELFPAPHPLGRRVSGDLDSVGTITREDLIGWQATRFGANLLTVAMVGGINSIDDAAALVGTALAGWNANGQSTGEAPPPPHREGETRARVEIAGKSQADVAIGLATVSRLDPDFYGLDVANLILGRLGLMGRLGATVRDAQGLAYYAFSGVEPGREGSVWVARAGVDPANVDRAVESIARELARIVGERVSAEELADAKSYLTGSLPLALETNDRVAATLLAIEYFALGLDFLDRYPGIIKALTADDIQAAAEQFLRPEVVAIAIAGPPL
ncbi:MAG: insulinase family protein [Chloroflexia bacterium]|nr:insulinase family protein [Chloroflexia bacterium]